MASTYQCRNASYEWSWRPTRIQHSTATLWWNRKLLSSQGVKAKKGYSTEYNRSKLACGHFRNFLPSSKGLHYIDFSKDFKYIETGTKHVWFVDSSYVHDHTILSIDTFEANRSKFSKQEILQVEGVQKFQNTAGCLSYWHLLKIAQKSQLKNVSIIPSDVRLMQTILCSNISSTKGKGEETESWSTIRHNPCTTTHIGLLWRDHTGNWLDACEDSIPCHYIMPYPLSYSYRNEGIDNKYHGRH